MSEKTIAAISTPPGAGGISVIRISGASARLVADEVFVGVSGKKIREMRGYTAQYGAIFAGEEKLDEVVALVFAAPHSYTGEDVVEISCHGGRYLTKQVLRAILSAGAVPAEPGEFTKRAFLNGKLGLTQAESVMDLISANSRQAARAARAAKDGALFKKIDAVKRELLAVAAHLSAWADYPEEEIEEVQTQALLARLEGAREAFEALLASYDMGALLRDGIETVIVGRPNVGKSTLMNLLAGRERSIVTDIPGTTRDVVEDTILLEDITLNLADTAGIRDTDDPIEQIGVLKAKSRMKSAALVLAVFDASKALSDDDRAILRELKEIPSVAILNKSDLPAAIDRAAICANAAVVVELSALSGEGLDALNQAICEVVGADKFDPSAGVLANERQFQSARGALECISEAIDAIASGFTLDAVTISIEGAIQELLALTGERVNEAVVEQVFSQFCVGK